jgi:hypothetical protein
MAEITQIGFQINKHPIAQSFFVDRPDGIFITKVGIFFAAASTDTSFPVTLQLRPVVNGVPSATTIIPGSTVVLSQATIAADVALYSGDPAPALATVETEFEFTSPIYLSGNTMYAIVLLTNSADYQVYIAETEEFKVGTTQERVDKNPISGTLFTSSNSITYTPVQNQDLTFKLYKANFNSTYGEVFLRNAPVPNIQLPPDPIRTTSGSTSVRVFHLMHGLQSGDNVIISGSSAVGGIPDSDINGTHAITDYDYTGYTFTVSTTATASASGGGSNIYASKNILYSQFIPKLETLRPNSTQVLHQWSGTIAESFPREETQYQKTGLVQIDDDATNITLKRGYLVANKERELAEIDATGQTPSLEIRTIFNSVNAADVAPYLDLQRASFTGISAMIDNQSPLWDSAGEASTAGGFNDALVFVPETNANNGSAACKHITKVTNLQELSKGLKILLSANRPSDTSIDMYYRIANEGEVINEKTWIYINPVVTVPSDDNPSVFREYEYLAGGETGTLSDFTQYQLKIVLRSKYLYKAPTIRDLRAIALVV